MSAFQRKCGRILSGVSLVLRDLQTALPESLSTLRRDAGMDAGMV